MYKSIAQNLQITEILDRKLIALSKDALASKKKVSGEFPIVNTDRAVGTMLSYEISTKYGGEGLPEDTINCNFRGSAGQSFAAFGAKGLTFRLEGEANDYFGKGLSGAKLIVYPDRTAKFVPEKNVIVGNVCFYGATSGEAYMRGTAGQRFCVRNSGATAIVEGVGDHACEYMTGGTVVVLGDIGRNFAAGMSGGVAFVYDPAKKFEKSCNKELVDLDKVDYEDDKILKDLIVKHKEYTGSSVAERILADWDNAIDSFVKVFPRDYKAALAKKKQEQQEKNNA